jgi:hypothetical protein
MTGGLVEVSVGGADSIGLTGDRSLNYRLIFGIAENRLELLRGNFLRDLRQVERGQRAWIRGRRRTPATSLRI